jgi:hypothetical protein
MMMKPGQGQDSDIAEVDDAIEKEIKAAGVLMPLAKLGKKYDEAKLAKLLTAALRLSFDPKSEGPSANPAGMAAASMSPNGRRLMGWWSDLWDDIKELGKDIGCGAVTTGALPGYLLAFTLFHTGNPTGYSLLSGEQKFFQRSVFSNDLLAKVRVKYSAWFAPGFGDASGVTMGTEIYLRAAKANVDTNPTWNMTLRTKFSDQIGLLNHELGHSNQYNARKWNIAKFGWDYLYKFCEAGFSYSKNAMEKDAETYRGKANGIMKGGPLAHFKKWKKDGLEFATGFSKTPVEYSNFQLGSTKIMSIDLTKATNKVAESQRKAGTYCVRVLWGSSLSSRTKAEINDKPWDCVNHKPTKQPTKKPTTRKPTSFSNSGPGNLVGKAPTAPLIP